MLRISSWESQASMQSQCSMFSYYFRDQAGEFKTARDLFETRGWLVVEH